MQNKGKPIFGLKKLAAEVLLKYSQQEVGKLTSYVQELECDKKRLMEQIAEVSKENAVLAFIIGFVAGVLFIFLYIIALALAGENVRDYEEK